MSKILLLILMLLSSCGTRKAQKISVKENTEVKTEQTTTQEEQTTSDKESLSQVDIRSENISIEIEPVQDWAEFYFFHNGKKIEGKTTGKIKIRHEEKKEQKQEIIHEKTEKKQHTQTQQKVNKKEQKQAKTKHTERDSSKNIIVGIGIVLLLVIGFLVKIKYS